MNEIVIATGNPDKFKEIKSILSDTLGSSSSGKSFSINFLRFPAVLGTLPEESGSTLEENAIMKAETSLKLTNRVSIADDTGLEVDALGGLPGIHTARFAGHGATYADNREKFLKLLGDRPIEERRAIFRTVVAIASAGEPTRVFEGTLSGYITNQEKGKFGFGYDPIFLVPGLGKTLAELTPEEKNLISHRAQALLKLKEYLKTKLVK